MRIEYQKIEFAFRFKSPVYFDVYPAFLFRSLLGMELRRLSCLFGERRCDGCSLKLACPYSFLFETPVDKDNEAVSGRDRAAHPFALLSHAAYRKRTDSCLLEVSLFGKAIDYLPYVYHAFVWAGERGALRSRTKFAVEEAKVESKSIIAARGGAETGPNPMRDEGIDPKVPRRTWIYGAALESEGNTGVELLSPLRLKVDGKYTKEFNADSFFSRLHARAHMLAVLYGDVEEDEASDLDVDSLRIAGRQLDWMDLDHYSSRQGGGMRMGGAIGSFSLEGKMGAGLNSLLDFAGIFHAGKNPSFGLGALEVKNG